MTGAIRTMRTSLFALVVAGALGFGASTALASTAPEDRPCPLTAFGSCNNQDQCVRTCTNAGYATRGCSNGCCYCVFI